MKKVVMNLLYPLIVVLFILFFWEIAAIAIDVDLILPSPIVALQNVGFYLSDQAFWIALGWTFLRCIESFLIAFIIALLLASLSYTFKEVEKFINPFMAFVRAIPTMAIILILTISLSPHSAPVIIACIVICPTLYQSFLTGFKEIDPNLVEMVTVYQVPKRKQILKFYIPSVLPTILSNSATGFSLNIKLVIAAEALAQTRLSIGRLMQFSKINLEVEKLFALTIVAVLLSVICEFIIRCLMKRLCKNA